MNVFPAGAVGALSVILLGGCGPSPTVVHNGHVDLSVSEPPDLMPKVDLAVGPCGMCVAQAPLCDVKSKRCVACLGDGDCPDQAVCRMNVCMTGCSALHSSCGDAGSCDTDMGLCHGCLLDTDCSNPKLPTCDLPTGHCVACLPQNDKCPIGSWCGPQGGAFACVPGCRADIDCQVGVDGGGVSSLCCKHACVDTLVSPKSCGGCGIDCNGGACCGGKCASTQSDVKNCGSCGNVCVGKNAMVLCANGVCGLGTCLVGFADCNKDPADGCEISISGDVANCGGCGMVCMVQNASAVCIAGKCAIGACKPGFRDCDGNAANGCEVNVLLDPKNCGACGQGCAQTPHATAGCNNGGCVVSACDQGFGNCDMIDANGCEAPLAADPQNCGACGKVCPAPPNVITSCANSVCATGGCVQGYADCNGIAKDGCESKLATDAKNCGACNVVCAAPANATPACAAAVCGIGMCNAGFADCDNNAGNGCEVNTNTDKNNCGGCGKVCMGGSMCSLGSCLSAMVGTVCAKVNPSGILCGGNCTFNHAQYADAYCVLAGYTKSVSYTVLTNGSVNCLYYNSNGNANGIPANCAAIIGPVSYGLNATCDAIQNLVCQ